MTLRSAWINLPGILLLVLFLHPSLAVFGQAGPLPSIYVVQSYSDAFPWDVLWKKGLESVLSTRSRITYFEMNTKKLPSADHPARAEAAFETYLRLKPDLVILADDAAVKLVGPRLAGLPVPVVYIGVNNNPRNYFTVLPDNFTGILERPLLKRSMVYIKDILPRSTRALLLFDTDITSRIIRDEFFYGRDDINIGDLTASIRLVGELKDWERRVIEAKGKYDFIIIGLYQTLRNEAGNNVDPEALARWTSANSGVPVFGFWDFSISKDSAVGGLVLYGEDMGKKAGLMVQKILAGTRVETLAPEVNNQGILLFSRSQLARWNLTLPAPILREARFVD